MEHIVVIILSAIGILLNGCAIGAKTKAGEAKRKIALPIIMIVVGMFLLVLEAVTLAKGPQATYRAGSQDGQIEALNYLSQNGYAVYEVEENGAPYYTALGKKYCLVMIDILDNKLS